MRRLTIFLLLFFSVALDCAVFTRMQILQLQPCLTLCVMACLGAVYGRMSGALSGLCAGVLMDLLFGPARGFYALIYLVAGYLAGAVYERGMQQTPLAFGLFVGILYIVREVITAVMSLFVGVQLGNALILFIRFILPAAVMTGVLAIPVFLVLRLFLTSGYMAVRHRTGLD